MKPLTRHPPWGKNLDRRRCGWAASRSHVVDRDEKTLTGTDCRRVPSTSRIQGPLSELMYRNVIADHEITETIGCGQKFGRFPHVATRYMSHLVSRTRIAVLELSNKTKKGLGCWRLEARVGTANYQQPRLQADVEIVPNQQPGVWEETVECRWAAA